MLVHSIAFAAYHVPNHGPSRILDIVISGCIFAYLALKYSFFAPLVLHYMSDANSILDLVNINL
ncbi:CPBP family glutamic-type intramembrane protease [Clostridium pasteurianum]|uniref:CPBP family glutamic-type intramembrane protease n=1 Tax=Clostridium pasteurianum TaxID=1501 RepID=UPI003D6D2A44